MLVILLASSDENLTGIRPRGNDRRGVRCARDFQRRRGAGPREAVA